MAVAPGSLNYTIAAALGTKNVLWKKVLLEKVSGNKVSSIRDFFIGFSGSNMILHKNIPGKKLCSIINPIILNK